MEELYWITRLDAINNILALITIICVVLLGLGCLAWWASLEYHDDIEFQNFIPKIMRVKFLENKIKYLIAIIIIAVLGNVFLPSTKDAYIIYGVGSVIEYVKNDTTAQQLPHKAVIALDKYLEQINKEEDAAKDNE